MTWVEKALHYAVRPSGQTTNLIKGEAELTPDDGLVPGFSASGQDVWLSAAQYRSPGLVLSAVGARCGKVFLADFDAWGVVANTSVLLPEPGNSLRFLWYLLNCDHIWVKGGAAQPYVRVPESLQRRHSIPAVETQHRIADMLDTETARIDTLIQRKQSAAAAAHARLERMRWDLVTGRAASTERKNVTLAWADTLPESWPLIALSYLITSRYGFPFNSEGFTSDPAATPVVRIRDVLPNRVQTWTEEAAPGSAWVHNGDIVIGMDGDFNHVRWAGGPAAMNQRVCAVRSSSENLTDEYLTEVLGYPLRHINETVHFTTVKHLSFVNLTAEKIPAPPLVEQAIIVRELSRERDATDRLASATSRSIELLRLRRQSLITAAVTGQIEV